jgi:SAM-dependent methyltransferase
MRFLERFLTPNTTFLEIGPGDCALSMHVATRVARVYAVDVSTEITRQDNFPDNFSLEISDGSSIPVPNGSVDVAYSNQLMEHLHPDDAVEQARNVVRALNRKGVYICITPNRLGGPNDISGYFDEVPTGFHLKEYTVSELRALFLSVGFSSVSQFVGTRGLYVEQPAWFVGYLERLLDTLPRRICRRTAQSPLRMLLTPRLVARR